MAATSADDLTWLPAWRIRDLIAKREVSALEVTNHFLGRIQSLDPQLHMFRKFDVDGARAQAAAADAAVRNGAPLGVLHGIPLALKEHLAVRGMPYLRFESHSDSVGTFVTMDRDSIVAERLRAAGAIITGVTVMPGMGIGSGMPDLSRHPRNPWKPNHVPGSSSAGSAAVVASGALPIAIGSDGGGSTRLPAALNGVIGVHTTAGRLANVDYEKPHLMLTTSFGPIARDVRDCALVMKATSGPDGRDMLSTVHGDPPDYLAYLDRGAAGMKAVWTDDYGFTEALAVEQSPRVIAAVREAAKKVTALDATFSQTNQSWESFWPHYLATDSVYSGGQAPKPTPEILRAASEVRMRNRAKFDALLREYDVLMSPTIQFTAPTVEQWNASWRDVQKFAPTYTSDTFMFNWLGLPAMSIPVGFIDGMPIGLQLVGPPDSEPKLFRLAQAYLSRFPRNERPPAS
ncbi:MAG: amidase [Sphingomonadales bacterium]|nr:MAG: amidase [Sphingomonadales bacterium]